MKNSLWVAIAAFAVFTLGSATASPISVGEREGSTARMYNICTTDSTPQLIALVKDAAALIQTEGEAAFDAFRVPGSKWRQGETYIFVLDPGGNMLVHPDPALEGKNELDLKDVNGKPIIRGLLEAAMANPDKTEGWYHYQWPVPDGLLPRWKSSFVIRVAAPSGKEYVVGCGDYNDRMDREFVVDMVKNAAMELEKEGKAAFPQFLDPAGPYRAKDAYLFVFDPQGVCLFNAAFPYLEGQNLMEQKDTEGKFFIREMLQAVEAQGSGWHDYMWPKPGESVSTQKSAYLSKAEWGDSWMLVGCGVYLADAPSAVTKVKKMTAPELMDLVREAAVVMEKRGEKAFPDFRKKGSKWFKEDHYFFVWTLDGIRYFHATKPEGEGDDMRNFEDVLGRPMGQMMLAAGNSEGGEGWVHYMYPEPGSLFPTWKSSFVKRVTFPSGKQYIIGCGIYNMDMDKPFIEDLVNRGAELLALEGQAAFERFRDPKGPFLFMDTYLFVDNLEGVELVNPAQPSLEGQNLMDKQDASGKYVAREYLQAAVDKGSAWVDYLWYKPGDNKLAQKHSFVRAVEHDGTTYVIGAGFYGQIVEE